MNNYSMYKYTVFKVVFLCAFIVFSMHFEAYAQSRPDPFEGANSAIDDLLGFFRSTLVKGICGLAITGSLLGGLFKLMPWKSAFITMAASLALLLVPEFVAFLTAE